MHLGHPRSALGAPAAEHGAGVRRLPRGDQVLLDAEAGEQLEALEGPRHPGPAAPVRGPAGDVLAVEAHLAPASAPPAR